MKDSIIYITCAWFVVLSILVIRNPEWVGQWQAKVEFAFVEEADRLGLWSE